MSKIIMGKKSRVGLLQQSKASNHWTAAQSPSADFVTLNYNYLTVPDPGMTIDEIPQTSQASIYKEKERRYVDKVSGLAKLTFGGLIHKKLFAPHLAASLLAVIEDSVSPYDKSFFMAKGEQFDFANNEGYLFTIAFDVGASANDGIILKNAILDSYTMEFNFNTTGTARLVSHSGTWVGNEMNYEQALSGSWVDIPTLAFYNDTDTFSLSTFTINSVDFSGECVRNIRTTINNNVSVPCRTTAGKPNQYRISPTATLVIDMDYNSYTQKILKSYQQGDEVVVTLTNDVTPDTDGELSIVIPSAIMTAQPLELQDEFLGIRIQAEVYKKSGSSFITVNMTDTVDWGF